MEDRNPEPIGSPVRAYEATLELLARLRPGRVLDCPAGHGAFSKRLLDAGYRTACCDILPELFQVKELTCERGDLNDSLPYGDGSFGAITCLNGLHRVWARGRAIREFERVLEPGGHLVLTFVNNINLTHRLTYLLTGSVIYNTIGPPHVCLPQADQPAGSFRYPMTIAHVASAVRSVGMEWGGFKAISLSTRSLLLSPLALAPLIFKPLAPQRYKQYAFLDLTSSPHALFGDYLIAWARKPERAASR